MSFIPIHPTRGGSCRQADQEEGGRLVKRPGDQKWMPDTSPLAARITTIKCKDGSYAVRVTPEMPPE
jgi:hypothetical protein